MTTQERYTQKSLTSLPGRPTTPGLPMKPGSPGLPGRPEQIRYFQLIACHQFITDYWTTHTQFKPPDPAYATTLFRR